MINKKCCGTRHYFQAVGSDNFGWRGWVGENNEFEAMSVHTTYGNL
jgi:hypothetical protein